MTEAQIKLIRRREYYNRRVKANFAPKPLDQSTESPSDNDGTQSPGLSPAERAKKSEKKKKALER